MIDIENLHARAGDFALRDISLSVPRGSYSVLMGKTGSGKTTVLECVCGLRPIVSGSVRLAGRDVTALRPAARGVGYVPQDGALFPTMTVRRHLGFALEIRRRPRRDIEARVKNLADWLGIAHLLDRKPPGLSGGEQQRVALGRALSFGPAVLLLDEPFSALDDETRDEMYAVIESLRDRSPFTALHVTHNRAEASRLGDRVWLLRDGRVTPTDAGGVPDAE
jgi:molybdate/tungstate transport system ATP-binding protein